MSEPGFVIVTRVVDQPGSFKVFGPFASYAEATRTMRSIASVRVVPAILPLHSPEALRTATKREALRFLSKT
ncbi:MAG: hypothetical protein RL885_25010 [Planctomycetota bacterium]